VSFCAATASSQTEPTQAPVIRVDSSLVLVDIITQNTKTALLIMGLKKQDFRVFDNDAEQFVQTFDAGALYSARPIALWLVMICNEIDWDENGSGFIRGQGKLIRPALEHLDKSDTIAVAHWCDDESQKIDFAPSHDVDGALREMNKALFHAPKPVGTRSGELALQRMLRLILDDAHKANPQPLPVIVFFYGDHSGMTREEADVLLKDLLETSVIVFGINDGAVPVSPLVLANAHAQPNVAHFLTAMTGGQYFSVQPKQFAAALDDILVQVHFRYVVGFQPTALDGQKHTLKVELTEAASRKFPSIRMAFRPSYIPAKPNQ
jgi:hypothetical protein